MGRRHRGTARWCGVSAVDRLRNDADPDLRRYADLATAATDGDGGFARSLRLRQLVERLHNLGRPDNASDVVIECEQAVKQHVAGDSDMRTVAAARYVARRVMDMHRHHGGTR